MMGTSSHQKLYDKIWSELQSLPDLKDLRVLDLSCGDAQLLSRLAEQGGDCTGTRYKEGDYILKNTSVHPAVKLVENVDLGEPLPFESESFDVVIFQEVIEHLPNHNKIVSEIGRVLSADGYLFLSTPNLHRLHSRLHFLFTGSHKLKRKRIGWEVTPDEVYSYHFNPVDFSTFHTLLYLSGIKVLRLPFSPIKWKYLPFLILYPLIFLCSFLEYRVGGMRSSASRAGERDLRRWMTSLSMLISEHLLIVGRKID